MSEMDQESLKDKAKYQARLYGVDPAVFCALIEQESAWDCWAMRYEPAFFERYVEPLPGLSDTEKAARATSWGLCQVMGQVARELGFAHKFLTMLCDPDIGMTIGANKFSKCLTAETGDVHAALLKWNGGGNPAYPDQVMARMAKYA